MQRIDFSSIERAFELEEGAIKYACTNPDEEGLKISFVLSEEISESD